MPLLNEKGFLTCFTLWKVDCSALDICFDHRWRFSCHGSTNGCPNKISFFALVMCRTLFTPITIQWQRRHNLTSSWRMWMLYRRIVCLFCKETLRMNWLQTFSKSLCNRLQLCRIYCSTRLWSCSWRALSRSDAWATRASCPHSHRLFDPLVQVVL